MFEGRQFECSSQHKVRLLVGTLPGEDDVEPYPLAVFLANASHGEADRAMTQYAASGYRNLRWVMDACLVY
jgi:hypothetical protein